MAENFADLAREISECEETSGICEVGREYHNVLAVGKMAYYTGGVFTMYFTKTRGCEKMGVLKFSQETTSSDNDFNADFGLFVTNENRGQIVADLMEISDKLHALIPREHYKAKTSHVDEKHVQKHVHLPSNRGEISIHGESDKSDLILDSITDVLKDFIKDEKSASQQAAFAETHKSLFNTTHSGPGTLFRSLDESSVPLAPSLPKPPLAPTLPSTPQFSGLFSRTPVAPAPLLAPSLPSLPISPSPPAPAPSQFFGLFGTHDNDVPNNAILAPSLPVHPSPPASQFSGLFSHTLAAPVAPAISVHSVLDNANFPKHLIPKPFDPNVQNN